MRQRALCAGISRRNFLQIGALALGGFTLPDLLRLKATAGATAARPRSVILLYLAGGPPHMDMYDQNSDPPPSVVASSSQSRRMCLGSPSARTYCSPGQDRRPILHRSTFSLCRWFSPFLGLRQRSYVTGWGDPRGRRSSEVIDMAGAIVVGPANCLSYGFGNNSGKISVRR